MRATTLTLRNDFHNSEARIRAKVCRGGWTVSKRAWVAACRTLCGMSDCQCGNIRGPITDAAGRQYLAEQLTSGDIALERC